MTTKNKTGQRVKVTKIATINEGSIPDGYTLKGFLYRPIVAGDWILIDRYERNGNPVDGVFRSSDVEELAEYSDHISASTKNSIYRVEFIE